MAELILSPVATKIIEELGSAAVKEIALLWGVNEELDELEDTISTIKDVLLDAEEKQLHNRQVRNWLQRLAAVVHDADDLSDEINTEALRRKAMSGNELVKQVRTFFSASNQLAFRHKMGSRIKGIKKKLATISNDRSFLLEVRHDETGIVVRKKRETYSFVRQEEVIGRDKDRVAIINLLLEESASKDHVMVIPIVGMGGLGKTTLAQCVYNDEMVNEHFGLRIWVCVSDDFDLKVVIQNILKSSGHHNNLRGIELIEQLQKELRNVLGGKRYLLVLDDVWNEDHEKWRQLKDLLVSTGSVGSRVIVTTRSVVVAQITSPMQPYHLGILDDVKSWVLFKMVAFKEGEEPTNASIVDIGKKIVKKCGGNPLAIRTIGSLLATKLDLNSWSSIDDQFSKISQPKENILLTLKLSYDHLAPHLKHCFAYCRLFEKDCNIDVQTLIQLWMAQGFLKLSDPSCQCMEEVGYLCFMDLVERSFFQEVELDEGGTIVRCKMHDLMHDLAIQVAGTKCVSLSSSKEGCVDKNTHHVSDVIINSSGRISTSLVQASKLRTILSPRLAGYNERKKAESTCNSMLSSLKMIRTLDLKCFDRGILYFDRGILPDSIGKLKHLRYLDLSGNWWIKTLPNSITNLLNLQTLKLNGCLELRELPKDLKKLVNLRHLEIANCYTLTHMPNGMGQLTNLQTLSKYVLCESSRGVRRHSGELKELNRLNNLRGEMQISNLRHGKEAARESASANLKAKQYLRSLTLKWNYEAENNAVEASTTTGYEMSLEAFQPQPNLQELCLVNYGGIKFSSWLLSLTNLVKLSLKSCEKCQDLPPLNQFCRLKELTLEYFPSLEYISNKSIEEDCLACSSLTSATTLFPSLQRLDLSSLPNLKGWWKTTSTPSSAENDQYRLLPYFPCLSSLSITGCPKLTCMPLYPHLEDKLRLLNTSLKPFQQTTLLPTTSSFAPLSKLKSLHIWRIKDLECCPDWFRFLPSVKELDIRFCSRLYNLCPGIQHLASLRYLTIADCEKLEDMMLNGDATMWKSLNKSLRSLLIQAKFPKSVALPEGIQHLSSLETLRVYTWKSLTTIPEWICNLKSLETLEFRRCPNLTSLPEGIRNLTSLWRLEIRDSPILLKRCQTQIGEDWPKIAHIQDRYLYPDPNEESESPERKLSKSFGLCYGGTK